MKGKEIVETIDRLIDEKKHDELDIFLKENPRFGYEYVTMKSIDIKLNVVRIERVALSMSYMLGSK